MHSLRVSRMNHFILSQVWGKIDTYRPFGIAIKLIISGKAPVPQTREQLQMTHTRIFVNSIEHKSMGPEL